MTGEDSLACLADRLRARRALSTYAQCANPAAAGENTTHGDSLHPRRLALQLAVSRPSIAQAFELTGAEARQRGSQIAGLLTHAGKDLNWRPRPSPRSALWLEMPAACTQKANAGDASHRNLRAIA